MKIILFLMGKGGNEYQKNILISAKGFASFIKALNGYSFILPGAN
jgi:hypothetical protein